MKTLTQELAQYGAYHRNTKNILTHFVGIPMIVLAIAALLSRPVFDIQGVSLTPTTVMVIALGLYYLRLDIFWGLVMSALLALTYWFGAWSAAQSTAVWLEIGIGGFLVGWIFQLVGHYFEGRKPAFVDDVVGLLTGPLFVVVEVFFMLGLFQSLKSEVDSGAEQLRHVSQVA